MADLGTMQGAGAEAGQAVVEPVRKSIRVRASAERAFRVFSAEMDSW